MLTRSRGFEQAMAGAGIQLQAVKLLEISNAPERLGPEGDLAVKGVQHDAFEQVTQCDVFVFRKRLQHFQQAFLHADPGLNAFYNKAVTHGLIVPWYLGTSDKAKKADRKRTA